MFEVDYLLENKENKTNEPKNPKKRKLSFDSPTIFRTKKTKIARTAPPQHVSQIPNTYCYQAIGGRKSQQDALITGFIKDFEQLSEEKQPEALRLAFNELQEKYGPYERSGSTIALCISYGNKIIIANLGDSPIYLMKKDLDDTILKCQRLNTLHRHTDGKLHNLEVTRAIGNTKISELSHEPEISFFEVDNSDLLLIASDGLIHKSMITGDCDREYICSLFESAKIKNLPLEKIPQKLKEKAIDDGSIDNISIILNQINAENSHAQFFLVCDGHGPKGEEISNNIAQNFQRILNEKVQQLMFSREFKMA